MSEVIDRPLSDDEKPAPTRLRIVDCDVHPSLHSFDDLNEFLPKRWQQHLREYGSHLRTPYLFTTPYPRSSPLIRCFYPRLFTEGRKGNEAAGAVLT